MCEGGQGWWRPAHVGVRREAREERGRARERGEEEQERDEGDGHEREQPLVGGAHGGGGQDVPAARRAESRGGGRH